MDAMEHNTNRGEIFQLVGPAGERHYLWEITRTQPTCILPRTRRRIRQSSSEMAVSWGWGVNSALGVPGDELDGDGACLDGAFVADEMDVVSPVVDEAHALGVDAGFAFGVVASVFGHGSFCDDDQAVTRVGVPAGASSGLPYIVLDVEVGWAFGLL